MASVWRTFPAARDGRYFFSPQVFDVYKYLRFVVDYYIMIRRIALFNLIQVFLFVFIDQHAPFDGLRQTALGNLLWLKARIAVGDNDRQAQCAQVLQRLENVRIQGLHEWIIVK